jgi:hypothetical protein
MTIILSLAALHGMALGQIPALVEAIGDRHLQNPEPARELWRLQPLRRWSYEQVEQVLT